MTMDESVKKLTEVAARHREFAESQGDLHPEVWEAIRESPIIAAQRGPDGVPGVTPVDLLDAITRLSTVDSSAGWALAIHGPAAGFLSFLDPEAAERVADRSQASLIGGSSMPAGTVAEADGGVRLSGTWPLLTGATALSWAALAAMVEDESGARRPEWFFVPASELRIESDWDTLGLRGSGSCSVTVSDSFVPDELRFSLMGKPIASDSALTRFPIFGLMAASIAGVALGTARLALATFIELASTIRPRNLTGHLAAQPHAQMVVSRVSGRLDAATIALTTALGNGGEEAALGDVSESTRAAIRLASDEVVRASVECCIDLYDAAGVASIYRVNRLERCLRDVYVIKQHAVISAASALKTGRYLLAGEITGDL